MTNSTLNPCWQIMENSSKYFPIFQSLTGKLIQYLFRNFNFAAMSPTDFWKIYPREIRDHHIWILDTKLEMSKP